MGSPEAVLASQFVHDKLVVVANVVEYEAVGDHTACGPRNRFLIGSNLLAGVRLRYRKAAAL